ncbi:MAG: CPBP family intramembrane glutamic endopeptidase [Blastocatellia bacterium]
MSQVERSKERTDEWGTRRLVSGLEVLSLLFSVLVITWGVVPLVPGSHRSLVLVASIPALLTVSYSMWLRGERLADLGLTWAHAWKATRLLALPTSLGSALFLGIGWWTESLHLYDQFGRALFLLPVSGIAQQTILQGVLHRRLRELLPPVAHAPTPRSHWMAIGLTALLFSLLHAPNGPLMGLTFAGGLVWSWVYDRAPNLLLLGISHGMVSLVVICTLPSSLLDSLSVGYKHLLYHAF